VNPLSEQYEAAMLDKLPPGSHRVVQVNNRDIGLFNIDGEIYALPSVCPHQFGPLCSGCVTGTFAQDASTHWQLEWREEGEIVTCPWHGLEFRIKTGQCLAFPRIKIRTYPTTVENGIVKITL
jgi:nitrite reductase/ring-hydroxylating ferredoxin subunit